MRNRRIRSPGRQGQNPECQKRRQVVVGRLGKFVLLPTGDGLDPSRRPAGAPSPYPSRHGGATFALHPTAPRRPARRHQEVGAQLPCCARTSARRHWKSETDCVGFDVLLWWKRYGKKFRVLALIAKDIFAIPVTSVASESAFSLGRRIIDESRTSLAPDTVQTLICTHDWMPTFRKKDLIRPYLTTDSEQVEESFEKLSLDDEWAIEYNDD